MEVVRRGRRAIIGVIQSWRSIHASFVVQRKCSGLSVCRDDPLADHRHNRHFSTMDLSGLLIAPFITDMNAAVRFWKRW